MSPKDPAENARNLQKEVARLQGELADRDAEIERLSKLVDRDIYLPLLNRRAFERELAKAWSSAQRYGF